MLRKVISGGQTGVDLAGLRAARACGISTGGWAPRYYMTEIGPRPFLLGQVYGLTEHSSPLYQHRTAANVLDADVTIIISDKFGPGSALTKFLCIKNSKDVLWYRREELDDRKSRRELLKWLLSHDPTVINIAGSRESREPGIQVDAEAFLIGLFRDATKP